MLHLKQATVADMRRAMEYIWDGAHAPHEHYTTRQGGLSEIRDAYKGGRRALRFLVRKPNESDDQWEARRTLFQNVRLVRTIVDARSDMIYGTQPERSFSVKDVDPNDPVHDELDDTVSHVYRDSNSKSLFRQRVAPARFRDGESNVKIILTDDEESPLRLAYMQSESVLWVPDPDDADAVLGCVEIRRYGREWRMTAHTMEGMVDINDSWDPITGTDEPAAVPGMLPLVRFGGLDIRNDFGTWADDALLDQKHLINVRSQFALGMRVQAFNQLFVSGRLKGTTYVGADGKERIMFSPEAVIEGEEGTTASYLNPNFPLTEALDVEKAWLKMTLEAYGVSGYTVDPSGAPEQPMALRIKMFRPMQLRSEDISEFEHGEYQLASLIKAGLYELGAISYGPDDVECNIEFPANALPMDKEAQRAADAADVAASPPRMTIRDYVKRHIMPDASDQDVEEYMDELSAQAGASAQNRATVVGSLLAPRTGILERLQSGQGAGIAGGPNISYNGGASSGGAGDTSSSGTAGPGPIPGYSTGGGGKHITGL